MKKIDIYKEFCSGCGLCHSIRNVKFFENEKGFKYPALVDDDLAFCQKFCPASNDYNCRKGYTVWGNVSSAYIGWSENEKIRNAASSGGALTAICCYLLDEGMVDGIIQTTVGEDTPYSTKTIISRTSDECQKYVGSRYSSSSPLYEIQQIIKRGERYVFIGKPCDVQSLKLYLKSHINLASQIIYCFSFFCAGLPSKNAQRALLKQLGCENETTCTHLDYRGNGWPGFATAYKSDGSCQQITYDNSWGKILGRDIRKSCKFCIDGIGEYADIVCADAWFINSDGTPDFTEHNGRNAIFSRNKSGDNVIIGAETKGYLHIEKDDEYINNFTKIQRFQNERRGAMLAMMLAMKLLNKSVPEYNIKKIAILSKNITLKVKIKRLFGTMKRIYKGKI